VTIVATTYISLAPYYAAWTNHAHWWVYAVLGTINSAFFVWLFTRLVSLRGAQFATKQSPSSLEVASQTSLATTRAVIFVSLGLFATATFAAWLQPLLPNNGSPIRTPLVAAGMETNALSVFAALMALAIIALFVARALARLTDVRAIIAAGGVVLIFAPLFFSVYTLTKESTAIFEIALKILGV
jgi:hypothetical protein